MATFQPFVEFTSSLGVLVVIYFGGQMAFEASLAVADLVAFFLYLDLFYQPVRNLATAWEAVQNCLAGADRVSELLTEEQEPRNIPGAVALTDRAEGNICFEKVYFHYSAGRNCAGGDQPANPRAQHGGAGGSDRRGQIDPGRA